MALARPLAAQLCAAFLFVAGGCATPDRSLHVRAQTASWAHERGLVVAPVRAGGFEFFALTRTQPSSGSLTVYIEGDGAPWATPWHPPRDPTPREPMALALAAADDARHVTWIARPCQYLGDADLSRCSPEYWMARRFAPEVIDAYDNAITQMTLTLRVRDVRLVGYSGGGVIAALLAARRDDVSGLVTVAAPLSLRDWTALHDLSPLAGSLDPAQAPVRRSGANDFHFAGSKDRIVPPGIIERFVRSHGGRLEIVADFDHNCCWVRDWPKLLVRTMRGVKEVP